MFAVLLINHDAGCGSQYYDANINDVLRNVSKE